MRTSQDNSDPGAGEDNTAAEAGRCGRCVSAVSALLRLVARTGCSWVFLCVWGAAACLGVLAIAIIGYKWC